MTWGMIILVPGFPGAPPCRTL